MKFEWDKEKNRTNELKHGISFQQASFIFDSEYIIFSSRTVSSELRMCVLGELKEFGVIFLVTTQRGKVIRMISARRASRKERNYYYGNRTNIA